MVAHQAYESSVEAYAGLLLDKSRFPEVVEVIVPSSDVSTILIGDLFTVEKSSYGWTGDNVRIFVVTGYSFNHSASTVAVQGQRHSNETYDEISIFEDLEYEHLSPDIGDYGGLPVTPILTPVTGLTASIADTEDLFYSVMLNLSLIHISEPTRPY